MKDWAEALIAAVLIVGVVLWSVRGATRMSTLADNAFIPFDPASTDYQRYLAWLAEGNEPLPADDQTGQNALST